MGQTGAYNQGRQAIANGLNLQTALLNVLLVGSGYTFNPLHNFVSNLSFELTGTGYKRQALASKIIIRDNTNDLVRLVASDVLWAGSVFSAAPDSAIIYIDAPGVLDSGRQLLCSLDLDPKIAPSGGANFTLQLSAGVLIIG